MNSNEKWYFAYGSNLKREWLRSRIGEWKQECKAILRGYRLTFAKGYYLHTSGKANIKLDPSSEVKGVIYLITENQLNKLDRWEGVNKGVYKRKPVNVESEGKLIPAITYEMVKEICPLRPSQDYLNLILEGLKEHGYDESVIKEVKKIAISSV
jgi:cation transport regulator ChaC